MSFKQYTVGLVVSAQGITDEQFRWLQKTLRWTLKALGSEGNITLFVPGITSSKSNDYGLPKSLTHKPLPPGVKMHLIPGLNGVNRASATMHRHSQIAAVDEVWCMPGYRQTNRLNNSRPALSFWYGVDGPRGHIYKWIPPWVDSHDIIYQPRQKELPWISK